MYPSLISQLQRFTKNQNDGGYQEHPLLSAGMLWSRVERYRWHDIKKGSWLFIDHEYDPFKDDQSKQILNLVEVIEVNNDDCSCGIVKVQYVKNGRIAEYDLEDDNFFYYLMPQCFFIKAKDKTEQKQRQIDWQEDLRPDFQIPGTYSYLHLMIQQHPHWYSWWNMGPSDFKKAINKWFSVKDKDDEKLNN